MSKQYFTISTPQYHIVGVSGEHFDIFNKRANAIKEAIKLAFEFPGENFSVIKKVNLKEKKIFSFTLSVEMDFADIKSIYEFITEASANKSNRMRYWRFKGK